MPNYILNYGTILFVMIANPILYILCSKEVDRQLIQRYGQYTHAERQINDLFKLKFSLINVIFYICWLPNIVNAVLMWTMWFNLPVNAVITTWYILAILNPLQAFFNVFVYRKWKNNLNFFTNLKNYAKRWKRDEIDGESSATIDEQSPLIDNPTINNRRSFIRI
jgi:ocular albinism type 1 protein